MEKIKLRKIYGTPIQKLLFTSIIVVSGLLIYTSFSVINNFNKEVPVVKTMNAKSKISDISNSSMQIIEFPGTKIESKVLSDNFYQVIYENEGKNTTHFIDVKKGQEVTINSFIKDTESFNTKIHELLLLVYPSKIVNILESSPFEYTFRDKDLYIKYDISSSGLETSREFYLIVDNNEIKDYIEFPLELNNSYENMNGFTYDPNKITISLTFDDGPNGERTRTLINNLEDYKMSATFFMLGSRYESNKDIVNLVYNSHSEVGYHNYEHNYYTKQTKSQIINEFNLADSAYYNITGDHIKLTRPPYGSFDQNTLDSLPTPLIRWNLDTNDWRYKDVGQLVNYVLENYSDGSIILFHDTYDTSIEAATILMEKLYLMDIQVVNVTELASIQGETMNAHEVYFDFK